MISKQDVKSPISYTRDLVADQSWTGVQRLLGTGSIAFDVSDGLGVATDTSIMYALAVGGFNNQSVTAVCRYTSTTAVGDEDLGILLRFQTNHTPNATYYYIRVDGQQAKITRVKDGTFSTLTQDTFALAQDTDVTITASIEGDSITANFDDGSTDLDLSVEDSSGDKISSGGLIAFRTQSSTGYLKSITVTEL